MDTIGMEYCKDRPLHASDDPWTGCTFQVDINTILKLLVDSIGDKYILMITKSHTQRLIMHHLGHHTPCSSWVSNFYSMVLHCLRQLHFHRRFCWRLPHKQYVPFSRKILWTSRYSGRLIIRMRIRAALRDQVI